MPVKVDRAIRLSGFGYRDGRTKIVILALAMRHEHVEAVNGSALKYRHQDLFLAVAARERCRAGKLMQKIRCCRHQPKAREPDTACLQKITSVHKCLPQKRSLATLLDAYVRKMVNFLFFAIAYR